MKRTTLLFILVAVAGVLVGGSVFRNSNAGIVRSVRAQEGCTLATLQGNYVYIVRADTRSDLPDPGFPTVVVGARTFDGAGNLSGVDTVSRGGQITRGGTNTGTYTLGSDCTGTMTISGVRNWDIVVASDGSEAAAIRTDEGTIATQSFKKR